MNYAILLYFYDVPPYEYYTSRQDGRKRYSLWIE